MAELSNVDQDQQLAPLLLLLLLCPCYLAFSLLLLRRQESHPINERSPLLVLLCGALLLASTLLVLLPMMLAPTTSPTCGLLLLSLTLSVLLTPLVLLLRSLILVFRLEITAEVERFNEQYALQQHEMEQRTASRQRKERAGSQGAADGGECPRRSASAVLLVEPVLESRVVEPSVKALWWVEHRWVIARPSLCCLFVPLLLAALLSSALNVQLMEGSADSCDALLLSPAFLSVRLVGQLLFVLHSAALLTASRRHPAAYGLRAEALATSSAALTLLPLSLGLSSAFPAASWYVQVSFCVCAFASCSALPVWQSLCLSRQSTSLAELPSIQSFDDLLRHPLGFESFRAFLQSEFSEENLLFWEQVELMTRKLEELERLGTLLSQRRERERRRREKAKDEDEQQQQQQQQEVEGQAPASTARKALAGVKSTRPRSSASLSTSSSSSSSLSPPLGSSPRSRSSAHREKEAGQPAAPTSSAPLVLQLEAVSGGSPRRAVLLSPRTPVHSAGEPATSALSTARDAPAPGSPGPHSLVELPSSQSVLPLRASSSSSALSPPRPHLLSATISEQLLPPFSLDGQPRDANALSKLRRVSWSIALEKKTERLRHRGGGSKHDALERERRTWPAAAKAPSSPRLSSEVSLSPRAVSPPASPPSRAAVSPKSLAPPLPAPSPASALAKSPFLQSIVKALQVAKRPSGKHEEHQDGQLRRLVERHDELQLQVLQCSCVIVDRFILPGSPSEVNLPDALVQQILQRMQEINARKYARREKRRRGTDGPGGMQHTLGLMRHATMHFLAAQQLHKGKVNVFAERLREKEERERKEQEQRKAAEDAEMVRRLSSLSFPMSSLFAAAQQAIASLMEKDSFTRYLNSPAFDHFINVYQRKRTTAVAAAGAAQSWTLSRQGSKSRLAITPRVRRTAEPAQAEAAAEEGLPGERRESNSVSLRLPAHQSPREQRSASFHAVDSRRASSGVNLQQHGGQAPQPLVLPPSPSQGPTPLPHALWTDVHKLLTLPLSSSPTARPHSGSLIVQAQLNKARATHQLRAITVEGAAAASGGTGDGGGNGRALTPKSSRRVRPSPSNNARLNNKRGLREEKDAAE